MDLRPSNTCSPQTLFSLSYHPLNPPQFSQLKQIYIFSLSLISQPAGGRRGSGISDYCRYATTADVTAPATASPLPTFTSLCLPPLRKSAAGCQGGQVRCKNMWRLAPDWKKWLERPAVSSASHLKWSPVTLGGCICGHEKPEGGRKKIGKQDGMEGKRGNEREHAAALSSPVRILFSR